MELSSAHPKAILDHAHPLQSAAKKDRHCDAVDGVRVCCGMGQKSVDCRFVGDRSKLGSLFGRWLLSCGNERSGRVTLTNPPRYPIWRTSPVQSEFDFLIGKARDWDFRAWGFGVRTVRMQLGPSHRYFNVPYWSIVTPLTLISAWLLVSRPRAKLTSERQG